MTVLLGTQTDQLDRLLAQPERPRLTGVVGDGNFKVESRHASEV
jgi:hypothetical protein